MMKTALLRRVEPGDVAERRENRIDDDTVRAAAEIVEDIRLRGGEALFEHSVRLGDMSTPCSFEPTVLPTFVCVKPMLHLG